MTKPDITIAGAGIAGLSAALALGQRDVLVLEKATTFSPIGAGIQLGPNAARALRALNIWDAVSPITFSPEEIHIRDGVAGKLLKRLKLGNTFEQRFGAPYRVAHRADLHQALLNVVEHQKQTRITLSQDSIDINLQANAIIAADGVHSSIRQKLFPNSAPIDTGEIYHRALVQLNDVKGIDITCVNLWMYPHAHVVHYPVGSPQRLNIIAITPKNRTPIEYFVSAASPLQELLHHAHQHFTPWPSCYAPLLETWRHQNILLLGDAAHAAVPYLAQGAAMALEDAACLKAVIGQPGETAEKFRIVEQMRKPRTEKLQRASLNAGKIYHATGLFRHARNATLMATPAQALLARLAWIYNP
jgi:salicylate hydroxylase